MSGLSLTFDDLRGESDCDSLAYWIGTFRSGIKLSAAKLLVALKSMSYMFDSEEQASSVRQLHPAYKPIEDAFDPIAPVQLVRRWCPIPAAVAVLGYPIHGVCELRRFTHSGCVLQWRNLQVAESKIGRYSSETPDQKRFARLLQFIVSRASQTGSDVLLTAQIGWSCDHCAPFTKPVAELMKRRGFVVTNRRSRGADSSSTASRG